MQTFFITLQYILISKWSARCNVKKGKPLIIEYIEAGRVKLIHLSSLSNGLRASEKHQRKLFLPTTSHLKFL